MLPAVGALDAEDRLVGVDARAVDDLDELRGADDAVAEALGGGGRAAASSVARSQPLSSAWACASASSACASSRRRAASRARVRRVIAM